MKDDVKGLSIMHIALCLGVLFIILILHFFMNPIRLEGFNKKLGAIGMMALIIASASLLFSNFIFKRQIAQIGSEVTSENIREVRAAYILKWALLEGAILINVLMYFLLEHHPILIVVALLLLLLLYASKPKIN